MEPITIVLLGAAGVVVGARVMRWVRRPARLAQDDKLTPAWTDADFGKLAALARRLRMNPADLLLVLTAESELDPKATNPLGAYGLNQLTNAARPLLGISEETLRSVPAMSVTVQLPLVERYFAGLPWTKAGRTWPHAPAVYQGNFAPGTMLIRGTGLDVVLYDAVKTPGAYSGNKGLDVDRKGSITVGDLARRLRSVQGRSLYMAALRRLQYVLGDAGVRPRLI